MNREKISDYLDGLLDDAEAREVEAVLARDPALAREAERLRAVLYRPYPVDPPPALVLPSRWRGTLWALARYAAVFVAGVLTARSPRADAKPDRPVVEAPAEPAPPYVNLRIQ